ncbi:MAG: T9SS type A sorting domain-containing protein [Candidatus Neomarinimicrobiota bacterium]
MKTALLQISLLSITFAQINPDADLTLQDEINTDYIIALGAKASAWQNQLPGGNDEATMKAHMGLAILAFAWSHIDADTMVTDIDALFEDLGVEFDSLAEQIDKHIQPILLDGDPDSVFAELINFFSSGGYIEFRDSLAAYAEEIDYLFSDTEAAVSDWLDDIDANFSDPNFDAHIQAVFDGTAEFEFALQVIGFDYDASLFVFNRTFFNRQDSLESITDEMDAAFGAVGNQLDAVIDFTGGDMTLVIDSLIIALDKMSEAVDTLKLILTSDPLAPFVIDVSGLDSLQEAIAEVDALLGGKVYAIGPDAEGKTIVPLTIIESLPGDSLWTLFENFYRSAVPAEYTFGEIFPNGLPADGLEMLTPDAVLNEMDDEDEMYARLQVLETAWLADVAADITDPDANFGLALVQAYEMVYDHVDIYDDVFRLIGEGRIDSLAYRYTWDDVDLTDEIDAISTRLGYYTEAFEEVTNFVVLINCTDISMEYDIGAESAFHIVMIPVPVAAAAEVNLKMAVGAAELIVDGLGNIYENTADVFVVNLDPTVLDFSQVDSDSDLVVMLELSNPNFLSLTTYGVEQFHNAGVDLEEAFSEMGDFFDNMTDLAVAVAPYDADFGIDGQMFIADMEEASDVVWEIQTDFADPDSVTIIDNERVNLSAWFDRPPNSFLMMWKYYLTGVDSTLGGLFPDRFGPDVAIIPAAAAPQNFILHHNYPNPFNPSTKLAFDLPTRGHVVLSIYDLRGNQIDQLVNEELNPGKHTITWNARELASGVYFIRLNLEGRLQTSKMILMK